jgi:hypothetical protein
MASFLITTPCDDGHKLCFWDSVRAFERAYYSGRLNTPHTFEFRATPGDSLVPRARNNHVKLFYSGTDFDYLFPIDSDLDFHIEDILRMADLAVTHDLDFLCGLYAIKQDELRWCINPLPDCPPDPVTGLQQIAMAPGGVHLISRRCIAAMIAADGTWPHWPIKYTDDAALDERWNLYYAGVVRDPAFVDRPHGRYLSEDWGISYLARSLGFKIWCDSKTVMLHRGECFYPKQARRLTQAETAAGEIHQPDGTTTLITQPEPV